MAEVTPTTTSSTPVTAPNPAATAAGKDGVVTPNEEMFEVQTGKDSTGNPVTKKYTKEQLLEAARRAERADSLSARTTKEREQIYAIAKALKDPNKIWDVLKGLGHNDEDLIVARAQQAIEDSKLSPEQKQARLDRAELDRLKKADAQRTKVEQEGKAKALKEQYSTRLGQTIDTALANAKLANSPTNRAAVAQVLSVLWNAKDENGKQLYPDPFQIPVDKVIAHIRTSRVGSLQELLEGTDDDSAYDLVGEQLLKRLAKIFSKRLQKNQPNLPERTQRGSTESSAKKNNGKLTPEEFRAEIEKRIRG